ncbi:hypothetical protein K443DRAFT_108324, partial [Laccaria amethystina LaAM-08-1]
HIYTHSKSEEKELQLSSAFASLAVLNHEIIAVVVASQTVTQEGSRLSGVFTENPRFDDRKTSAASEPILLTPDVPRQFKEFEEEMKKRGGFDDANILNQYIDKVLYSQGCQSISLDNHIWMLQKILNMWRVQGKDQSLKQLNRYMVIACFHDSGINIDHECLAMFLDCHPKRNEYKRLLHIYTSGEKIPIHNKDTFEEFHQLLLFILETYREGLNQMNAATGDDGPSKEEFRKAASRVNWAGFLLHRLNTGAALRMHLQTIGESLSCLATPSLPKSCKNEADAIQGEVDIFLSDDDLTAHEAGVPFNEGNDSADEEPLNSPQDADGRDNASDDGDPSDDGHAVASADPGDLNDNTLDDVLDGEPDNRDEDEDEFEEINSEAGYLATLKWMKLLVSQFNSASLLVIKLTTDTVSLRILKSPPVGVDMMSWEELFAADSNFFPTWSHRPGSRLWRNQDIAKFITSGVNANRRSTSSRAQNALNAWEQILKTYHSDYQTLFARVVQSVTWIQDQTSVPGCKESAADILKVFERNVVDILADPCRTSKVTHNLRYIADVCTIFGGLSVTNFKGSLHCEAALGTLISTPVRDIYPQYSSLLAEMQQYGRVIGTSKRCCPVCTTLLSIITPQATGQPFLIRGSHRTISSCTLPDWTPRHIVKELIEHFGQSLREVIGQLMERTHWAPLKYSPSAGSSALSVTSLVRRLPVNTKVVMAGPVCCLTSILFSHSDLLL